MGVDLGLARFYGNVAVMFLLHGFHSVAWTPLLLLYSPEVMKLFDPRQRLAFSSFALNGFA